MFEHLFWLIKKKKTPFSVNCGNVAWMHTYSAYILGNRNRWHEFLIKCCIWTADVAHQLPYRFFFYLKPKTHPEELWSMFEFSLSFHLNWFRADECYDLSIKFQMLIGISDILCVMCMCSCYRQMFHSDVWISIAVHLGAKILWNQIHNSNFWPRVTRWYRLQ